MNRKEFFELIDEMVREIKLKTKDIEIKSCHVRLVSGRTDVDIY